MPSFAQIAGVLRIAAPVIIWGVTQYFGADAGTQIGSLIATILGSGGWSLYANSTTSLAQTVADMKGVKVAVSPAAAPELLKLASDPTVPDVVHAEDSYSTSAPNPYSTQRRKS